MKKTVLVVLLAAMVVAVFLSPFASSSPDGLERVAEDLGFIEKGEQNVITSPIPDYVLPGIENEKLATSLAGAVGTLLTFGAMFVLAKAIAPGKKRA